MKIPTAHVITTAGHIKKLAYVIAVIGTVASYGTQVGLLIDNGFHPFFAGIIPGTVDILAICAAMALQLPGLPAGDRKLAGVVLTIAVVVSGTANIAGAHNITSGIGHAWPVVAYLLGELIANRVRSYAARLADVAVVAMVTKADADAALAVAMANAAADMATAVANAVAATEQTVRAALAAEAAELVAEAERATREAAAAESAARIEAERVARERATAERLARLEAERVALAEQVAKVAAKPVAKPATVATPRVATGQASATVAAILATDADMATDDVILAAMSEGVEVSARTVRRVKLEMRMAMAAA